MIACCLLIERQLRWTDPPDVAMSKRDCDQRYAMGEINAECSPHRVPPNRNVCSS